MKYHEKSPEIGQIRHKRAYNWLNFPKPPSPTFYWLMLAHEDSFCESLARLIQQLLVGGYPRLPMIILHKKIIMCGITSSRNLHRPNQNFSCWHSNIEAKSGDHKIFSSFMSHILLNLQWPSILLSYMNREFKKSVRVVLLKR